MSRWNQYGISNSHNYKKREKRDRQKDDANYILTKGKLGKRQIWDTQILKPE